MFAPGSNGRWMLVSITAVLLLSGCGGAESRKAKHFEKGQAFLAAGNLEKARVEFRNALQISPTDSEARYENGVIEEKLGRPQIAASFYQGAIDTNTDNVKARTALGRLYLFAGQPAKSLETIKPALAKHPDDAELLAVRAAGRVSMKDPAGAREDAQRAVQLAPANEDAVVTLAGIDRSEGQNDKAEALLRNAIKQNPNTVDLRIVLAQLESSLGKDSEVETLLNELVTIKPGEQTHRLRLAQYYARLNRIDDAEKVLRDGIKALPDQRAMKTGLVEFLAARRSLGVAETELKGFIAADPKDYELKFELAQFYINGKELPKAEAVYQQVIDAAKLEAPGLMARDRYAMLRVQQNDIKGAQKLIAEVLAESPRDDDALILRGNIALAQKDPKTAIADLRSVLRDQPNSVGVMRALARAHLANGEPALAEETMRRAVEGNSGDATVRLDLAQLLAQLGKPEQAKPIIDELVKQQPNNLEALETQFKIAAATEDFVTAKSAADAIVATQPKSGVGYYYQGVVADSEKRREDALKLFEASLNLEPRASEPLQAVTRELVVLKRAPDALKRLDELIAQYPKDALPAKLKGDVLLNIQRSADAIAAFRTAIDRDPKWWVPYQSLASAQLVVHDTDGAIATLKTGIERASSPESLQSDLAGQFEQLGRVDDAIGVLDSALIGNPQSDLVANNLAMLLVTYKKDQRSLDRAKVLVARFAASANANFLDTYGWVMYKRGDATAAITALREALAKAPQSPVSMYHLGMAQVLAGQNEAARDNLAKSLQAGQKFSGMDEARTTLDKLASQPVTNLPPPKS
ncbi:MAG: tetratricopeptide repeat protein [Steroidobacterales bacterium]